MACDGAHSWLRPALAPDPGLVPTCLLLPADLPDLGQPLGFAAALLAAIEIACGGNVSLKCAAGAVVSGCGGPFARFMGGNHSSHSMVSWKRSGTQPCAAKTFANGYRPINSARAKVTLYSDYSGVDMRILCDRLFLTQLNVSVGSLVRLSGADGGKAIAACDVSVVSAKISERKHTALAHRPESNLKLSHPCAVDEFRFGKWTERRGAASSNCDAFEYDNATCGPSFSARAFCAALRCRSLLVVGDSLLYQTFIGLQRLLAGVTHFRDFSKQDCPRNGAPWIIIRLSTCCDHREQYLAYYRHDHLILERNGSLRNNNIWNTAPKRGVSCDGWMMMLDKFELVLMQTGHHVHELNARNRASTSFHSRWAFAVAQAINLSRPQPQVFFLKAIWGSSNHSASQAPPLSSIPTIEQRFSWDLIPNVNGIWAKALKENVGAVVVDPTMAAALRPDCRIDALHLQQGLYRTTLLRLVQNAIGSLA